MNSEAADIRFTPYFIGIVPVCELIYVNPAQYNSLAQGIYYLGLAIIILMSIWDVLYWSGFVAIAPSFNEPIWVDTVTVDIALRNSDPTSYASLIAGDAASVGESLSVFTEDPKGEEHTRYPGDAGYIAASASSGSITYAKEKLKGWAINES
ncbi:hypothetical protein JB92DRAFT_2832620 [Gautieria morchelliformis]|nr:hypothetical protein JB92DRAFT_2832620 [Gautieria morchelliformis]